MKSTLARELSVAPPSRDIGKPRLAVDRVFTLPGTGTVVTGTLAGGTLQRGQSVVIQPGGHSARIRRIQSHGRDVEASGPGTRTALNLADVNPVEGVHRGDVVTLPEMGGASDCLDVMLEISARAGRPLKDGVRVRVHYGSGNVPAHVALGSGKELQVGGRELAQLRLEAPVFLCAGDHLTVRDWSEQQTLAGAVVLDPDATRRAFRHAARLAWLERVAGALDDPAQFVAAYVARDMAVRRSRAFVKTRFGQEEIDAAAGQLIHAGTVVAAGDVLVDAATWTRAVERAAELIDEAHRANPERLGLPLTDLRNSLKNEFPLDELFDSVIAGVCRARVRALRFGHSACRRTARSSPSRFELQARRSGRRSPLDRWSRPRARSWHPTRPRSGR